MTDGENIGELTLRSQDSREVVFSGIVKNFDNVTEDAEGFSPVKQYIQTECFEADSCNRVLKGTFKDTYNKENNTNIPYDIVIVMVAE